jgi:hypothetical protein
VGVDYYWITDTQRGEALVIAQRSGRETVPDPNEHETAPKMSFLMCPHDGYFPSKDTPQLHEFTKVFDSIDDAARIVYESTGLRPTQARPTLSDLWQGLVDRGYFNNLPYPAYAGGLFKPLQIQAVPSQVGPAQISVRWDAEYRGGGATSLQFSRDVPVYGVEYAQLAGTTVPRSNPTLGADFVTANPGDYLVASPGNGRLWKVESIDRAQAPAALRANRAASRGANYDIAFDKVTLGPLQ